MHGKTRSMKRRDLRARRQENRIFRFSKRSCPLQASLLRSLMHLPFPLPALYKAFSAQVVSCLLMTRTPVLIKLYTAFLSTAIILVSRIQPRFSGSSQASSAKTVSLFSPPIVSHRFLANANNPLGSATRCDFCPALGHGHDVRVSNSGIASRAFRRASRGSYPSSSHCG